MLRTTFFTLFLLFSPFFASSQCYNLVWEDDFTGTSLNTANWSYQTGAGGWGNNELEYYTDRTDNTSVSNGTLKIIAKEEAFMGSAYTSARIRTKDKAVFRYGKFTASIKLPIGQGIWPAFWMMPEADAYGIWPNSGELDIMELIGNQPSTSYGTIHGANNGSHVFTGSSYSLASGTFADAFHEFTMEWTPSAVRHYVDGQLFLTQTNAQLGANPWPFDQSFHFLLNLAVGGNWPGSPNASTIFPKTMEVDYVRVYQELADISITGTSLALPLSSQTYSVPALAATTFTWTAPPGASISSGQGTNSIVVQFGNTGGMVSVQLSNSCGTETKTKIVGVSPNVWPNPDFESNFDNWNFNLHNAATGSAMITTTNVQQGTKAANITMTNAGTNPWDAQLSRYANNIIPGEQYSLSFWAKSDDNRLGSYAFIHPTNYTYYAGSFFTMTPTWQKFTFMFTAPNGQSQLLFNLDLARFTGASYQFDNFSLAQTSLLPLDLLSFDAKRQGKDVLIEWRVLEHEMESYVLERAIDSPFDFENVEWFVARNGEGVMTYVFEDKNVPKGSLFYRLVSVEQDGLKHTSSLVFLKTEAAKVSIAPNPTEGNFSIKTEEESFFLELLDAQGQLLTKKARQNSASVFSIENYPSGVYFVKIAFEVGEDAQIFRIVKK